jgi:hypothetical protein
MSVIVHKTPMSFHCADSQCLHHGLKDYMFCPKSLMKMYIALNAESLCQNPGLSEYVTALQDN